MQQLASEGSILPVGAPIAVVCEGEGEQQLAQAARYRPPTTDVYDGSQASVRVLEWQSYLKESKEPPGCSKCMG